MKNQHENPDVVLSPDLVRYHTRSSFRANRRYSVHAALYRAWSWMMLLHLMKRITSFSATRRIFIAFAFGLSCASADEGTSTSVVSVAVKQVGQSTQASQSNEAAQMMSMAPTPPPSTLPAERLPQYRIGYKLTDGMLNSHITKGIARFVLTDPMILEHVGRPVLLEATITIDGIPFTKLREQKVSTLLAEARRLSDPPEDGVVDETASVAETDIAEATDESESTDPSEPSDNSESNDESESQGNSDEPEQADQPPKKPVSPATVQAYQLTSNSAELLKRYADAIGESIDEAEAGWLSTHWDTGPALLVLRPYFQSFRGQQRPAFVVLDRDRDGVISSSELNVAEDSVRRCDANRDDIVDVLEIAKAAEGLRDPTVTAEATGPLLWMLPDLIGVSEQDLHLYQALSPYDTNQNGHIEAAEVDALNELPPDIRFTVAFDREASKSSVLQVVSVNEELNMTAKGNTQGDSIDVATRGVTFCLSAIQSASVGEPSDQVAMGAVVDGYPLLPELDPNDDGRLTIRERRGLTEHLRSMDRDKDEAAPVFENVYRRSAFASASGQWFMRNWRTFAPVPQWPFRMRP
ncbi:MAG: hypothetical protein R3C05_10085 [Pirellulaceae bacterium]